MIQCGSIHLWPNLIIAMKSTQWIYEMTRHSHGQYKVDLCNSICVIVQEKLHRNLGKVHIRVITQPMVTDPDVVRI